MLRRVLIVVSSKNINSIVCKSLVFNTSDLDNIRKNFKKAINYLEYSR